MDNLLPEVERGLDRKITLVSYQGQQSGAVFQPFGIRGRPIVRPARPKLVKTCWTFLESCAITIGYMVDLLQVCSTFNGTR
jgi:hypothetical protein